MPTAAKGWKFLVFKNGKITSGYNSDRPPMFRTTWEIGEWKKEPGFIQACRNGFHHSNNPYDAFTYVSGSVLARVEVKGTRAEDIYNEPNHKEACSDMRIVKAGAWSKNDSVGLALHAADLAAAMLPAGNKYRELAERGMAAVRSYLANGTPVPQSMIMDLRDIPYDALKVGGVDPGHAVNTTYYAACSTQTHISPELAGTSTIYAISGAMELIDGYDGQSKGAVKAAVNTWMENRFKTLPRL